MCTDLDKLMHASKSTQNHPVTDLNMPGQLGTVRDDDVVAQNAVMRNMNISHDPVVAAYLCDALITRRTNVDGAKLANGVAVANVQSARFTRIFFILRNRTDGVELKNFVVGTDNGVAFNHAVRTNRGARADLDMRADHGVWANTRRAVNLRVGIDKRSGVNARHWSTILQVMVRMVHISPA